MNIKNKNNLVKLRPPSEEEKDILYSLNHYIEDQTRMSCQIILDPSHHSNNNIIKLTDMEIEIPKDLSYSDELKIPKL